jgi:Xaa-Pro aminopeptidase
MFSPKTYSERRKSLKQKVGSGLILLLGNEESSMNYKDNWYHFRQDSSFTYYFGINLPGLVGVIDCDTGAEIIFGNDLSIDDIVWTGPQPTVAELSAKVNVKKTLPLNKLEAYCQNRKVHYLPPYRPEHTIKIADLLNKPDKYVQQDSSVDLIKAIVSQRSYKTDEEVVELEKAVNLTVDMHLAAMKMARPGLYEYELAAEVTKVAKAGGGNTSFPVIMTINGNILHNTYYGNKLKDGDMVLCDTGAETEMLYGGDLTRTFPVGKTFSKKQEEIYQVALNSHEAAIKALKPGTLYRDVHLTACRELVVGLKQLGLMKGNENDAVAAGAHTMFFQCGLGHMMGLDIHDMENLGEQYVGYTDDMVKSTEFGLKSLRLGRALEPGFVLTVEPGVYIIPQLIDKFRSEKKFMDFINYDQLEKYRNFGGVRVEEDFLITKKGSKRLGKSLAKTIEDIYKVRNT